MKTLIPDQRAQRNAAEGAEEPAAADRRSGAARGRECQRGVNAEQAASEERVVGVGGDVEEREGLRFTDAQREHGTFKERVLLDGYVAAEASRHVGYIGVRADDEIDRRRIGRTGRQADRKNGTFTNI